MVDEVRLEGIGLVLLAVVLAVVDGIVADVELDGIGLVEAGSST